jgi:hypothetical protein
MPVHELALAAGQVCDALDHVLGRETHDPVGAVEPSQFLPAPDGLDTDPGRSLSSRMFHRCFSPIAR